MEAEKMRDWGKEREVYCAGLGDHGRHQQEEVRETIVRKGAGVRRRSPDKSIMT